MNTATQRRRSGSCRRQPRVLSKISVECDQGHSCICLSVPILKSSNALHSPTRGFDSGLHARSAAINGCCRHMYSGSEPTLLLPCQIDSGIAKGNEWLGNDRSVLPVLLRSPGSNTDVSGADWHSPCWSTCDDRRDCAYNSPTKKDKREASTSRFARSCPALALYLPDLAPARSVSVVRAFCA